MPYIKVNSSSLTSTANAVNSIKARVNRIKNDFIVLGKQLDWDIRAATNINSRINDIEKLLDNELLGLQKMTSFLYDSVNSYDNVSQKISDSVSKVIIKETANNRTEISLESQITTQSNPLVGKRIGAYQVVEQTTDKIVLERVETDGSPINLQDVFFRGSLSALNALFDKSVTNKIIIKPKGSFEETTDLSDLTDLEAIASRTELTVTIVEDGKYFDQETIFDLVSTNIDVETGNGGIDGTISDLEAPSSGNASVKASLADVRSTVRIGTEENNVHFTIGGEAVSGEAGLATGTGDVTYTDANGNKRSGKGVSYNVNADATAVEGKVSGGITINKVNVDVAGGIGVDASIGAKVAATDSGVAIAADLPIVSGDVSVTWDK